MQATMPLLSKNSRQYIQNGANSLEFANISKIQPLPPGFCYY
jgi:hypothetical protein